MGAGVRREAFLVVPAMVKALVFAVGLVVAAVFIAAIFAAAVLVLLVVLIVLVVLIFHNNNSFSDFEADASILFIF